MQDKTTNKRDQSEASAAISKGIDVFLSGNQTVELRSICNGRISSGYFNQKEALLHAALKEDSTAKGIFITINPLIEQSTSQPLNQPVRRASQASKDKDVLRRQWLPIDIDPERPSNTSSTDVEKKRAYELALTISKYLEEVNISTAVFADSGNGYHLLVPIDLPNDDASKTLVRNVLNHLHEKYSTAEVKVDTSVHNASRILKLYGTFVRKGENTQERPHRRSHVISATLRRNPATPKALSALASQATPRKTLLSKPSASYQSSDLIDIESFIQRHGLEITKRKNLDDDSHLWELSSCPFNEEHTRPTAYIIQFKNGAVHASCHHDSCQQHDFRTLWHLLEGTGKWLLPPHEIEKAAQEIEGLITKLKSDSRSEKKNAKLLIHEPDNLLRLAIIQEFAPIKWGPIHQCLTDAKVTLKPLLKSMEQIKKNAKRPASKIPINQTIIYLSAREHDIITKSLKALATQSDDIFESSGRLVRVRTDKSTNSLLVEPIPHPSIREHLSKHIWYIQKTKDGLEKESHPPEQICAAIRTRGDYPGIHHLRSVARTPIVGKSGTLITSNGYNEESEVLLVLANKWNVPTKPSKEEIQESLKALSDLFEDFPFRDKATFSCLLAALVTPFITVFIDAPTPIIVIDATAAGTGKTLIAEIISIISTNDDPSLYGGFPSDDEEMRKKITTLVRKRARIVIFDNATEAIGGESLNAALTGRRWEDRELGVNATISGKLDTVFMVTGNNIEFAPDTARRAVTIQLRSNEERPEQRSGFKIPRIIEHVDEQKQHYANCVLTLIAGFIAAGTPLPNTHFGSFEKWNDFVDGLIIWLGFPSIHEAREAIHQQRDEESLHLRNLIQWLINNGAIEKDFTASQLLKTAFSEEQGVLPREQNADPAILRESILGLLPNNSSGTPNARKLGKCLSYYADRVKDGHRIIRRHKTNGTIQWGLEKMPE